ncbi:unnamed protein product [Mytilus edulis]|uniref:Uncharacterized protein n=1 Tax=Mytilus edulis TaxID=6550 RepID=A0A8S3T293_MYTED|nr:unnamed protein product [Mytilus edulis]
MIELFFLIPNQSVRYWIEKSNQKTLQIKLDTAETATSQLVHEHEMEVVTSTIDTIPVEDEETNGESKTSKNNTDRLHCTDLRCAASVLVLYVQASDVADITQCSIGAGFLCLSGLMIWIISMPGFFISEYLGWLLALGGSIGGISNSSISSYHPG